MDITLSNLSFLAGRWEGTGRADYPTIEPLDYREELQFDLNAVDPVLHYEQRTWVLSDGNRKGQPIFWESGFLIDRGLEVFELVSAQRSGRMELLKGKAHHSGPGEITLTLDSTVIANDERVIRSGRIFTFRKERLVYELTMSTTGNRGYERHLLAELHRLSASPASS